MDRFSIGNFDTNCNFVEEEKEKGMRKGLFAIGILFLLFSVQNNIDIEDRNYGLILEVDLKQSGE